MQSFFGHVGQNGIFYFANGKITIGWLSPCKDALLSYVLWSAPTKEEMELTSVIQSNTK